MYQDLKMQWYIKEFEYIMKCTSSGCKAESPPEKLEEMGPEWLKRIAQDWLLGKA